MIERTQYNTTSAFFAALLNTGEDLSRHLTNNPKLLLEQEEKSQETLLHRVAFTGLSQLQTMLPFITLNALSVTNYAGRTPIHEAASWYKVPNYDHILPILLKKANELGYDFSREDKAGNTPLGIILANPMFDGVGEVVNGVKYFQQYVPTFEVNKIYKSGLSLLGIALTNCAIAAANSLLDLGADLTAFAQVSDRTTLTNPLDIIKDKIRQVERAINNAEHACNREPMVERRIGRAPFFKTTIELHKSFFYVRTAGMTNASEHAFYANEDYRDFLKNDYLPKLLALQTRIAEHPKQNIAANSIPSMRR